MAKITFYIARHGKTVMNTLDRVQGWCDSPLTKEGEEVAEYLGRGLKDINFRSVYCSTLERSRQTLEIVLKAKGQGELSIVEKDGFREACFGSFEGGYNHLMWGNAALFLQYVSIAEMNQAIAEQKLTYDEVLNAIKRLDTMGIAEDTETLRNRTQATLREVAEEEEKNGPGSILIISHGMSILGMLGTLGGNRLLKGALQNAAVCKVSYENGEFTVETMGDMSYVEKGKLIK